MAQLHPAGAAAPLHVTVVVPTLNAALHAAMQLPALAAQTRRPDQILVLDSESDDDTVALYGSQGCRVQGVRRAQFDHGATRNMGVSLAGPTDILVYMTQDALPEPDAIERILTPFDDPAVGLACGRQLPRPNAGPLERHARYYNYPGNSSFRDIQRARRAGVKAVFSSNSFAAYRAVALRGVGGFPNRIIMGEDQVVAGRMLLHGWTIAYVGEAKVVHSHGYTVRQEFQRYFDIGVFHAQYRNLMDVFGRAEGEGLRFVVSELGYLARQAPHRMPEAMLRTAAKLLAYHLGNREAALPISIKRRLAMHGSFFDAPRLAPLNSLDE
ncbi:MAG: glycosyltransferase family 2 protein [Alphaproteobacteria bacterium]|nr:MAG: glycosyltransferase family 2 protein [Alphaproteobacteria bacterium]